MRSFQTVIRQTENINNHDVLLKQFKKHIESINTRNNLSYMTQQQLSFLRPIQRKQVRDKYSNQYLLSDIDKTNWNHIEHDYVLWMDYMSRHEHDLYDDQFNINKESKIVDIMPSIEIELMWRAHRTNPLFYYNDCMNKYGKIIPHFITYSTMYLKHNDDHRNELHEFSVSNDNVKKNEGQFIQSLDIYKAVKRRFNFMKRVEKLIWLNFNNNFDEDDINNAIDRYLKFMYLMCLPNDIYPDKPDFIIPSFDVEIVWNAHQLAAVHYDQFCKSIKDTDQVISNYNNWEYDDVENAKLETQLFWNEIFNDDKYEDDVILNTKKPKRKEQGVIKIRDMVKEVDKIVYPPMFPPMLKEMIQVIWPNGPLF